MKKIQSLRFKMPATIIAIVSILTIALVVIIIKVATSGIESATVFGFNTTTKAYSRLLNVWITEIMRTSEQIAASTSYFEAYLKDHLEDDKEKSISRMKNIVKSDATIDGMFLLNINGDFLFDSSDDKLKDSSIDWRQTKAWQKLKENNFKPVLYETDAASPNNENKRVLYVLSGIMDKNTDEPLGILGVAIDFDDFADREVKASLVGKTGHIFIIDYEGNVLADPIEDHVKNDKIKNSDFIKYALSHENGYYKYTSVVDGKKYLMSYYKGNLTGFTILLTISQREIFNYVYILQKIALIGIFVLLITVSIVMIMFSRTITIPIEHITKHLSILAEGDLSWESDKNVIRRKDELGMIAHAQAKISEVLTAKIQSVIEASKQIADAAREVASGNTDLAHRTESQAASLEETASSMEEMASTIKSSTEYSKTGNSIMIESKNSVENVGSIITATTENIEEVYLSSEKISDITKMIENIAFQTNILALNAAVEAARAGEQGRGFAVVASEVRNLAQTTQKSVKDITGLIATSNEKIKIATETARESQTLFEDIRAKIEQTASIMGDITVTATEQEEGVEQVNRAVTEMDIATQKNAALVEEVTAASKELLSKADELYEAMKFFKLKE